MSIGIGKKCVEEAQGRDDLGRFWTGISQGHIFERLEGANVTKAQVRGAWCIISKGVGEGQSM